MRGAEDGGRRTEAGRGGSGPGPRARPRPLDSDPGREARALLLPRPRAPGDGRGPRSCAAAHAAPSVTPEVAREARVRPPARPPEPLPAETSRPGLPSAQAPVGRAGRCRVPPGGGRRSPGVAGPGIGPGWKRAVPPGGGSTPSRRRAVCGSRRRSGRVSGGAAPRLAAVRPSVPGGVTDCPSFGRSCAEAPRVRAGGRAAAAGSPSPRPAPRSPRGRCGQVPADGAPASAPGGDASVPRWKLTGFLLLCSNTCSLISERKGGRKRHDESESRGPPRRVALTAVEPGTPQPAGQRPTH